MFCFAFRSETTDQLSDLNPVITTTRPHDPAPWSQCRTLAGLAAGLAAPEEVRYLLRQQL